MDPLSIGSAVVGLIAAATRMAPVIYHFVTHTLDAPKTASQILDEMNSITAALERLQTYLMGASTTNVARRSLLSLNNIIATLTACVKTYSDLELVVNKCVDKGVVKRMRWMINEGEIIELVERVQSHKLSLTLMLTILQCESMQEAEDSMDRLVGLVEGLVTSNADLRIRIDALAMDHASLTLTSHATSRTSEHLTQPSASGFEADLSTSRPYRKLRPRESIYSISTSQRGSMALSAFSDLTLGNISIISVLCLPLWSTDLSNAQHYRFGKDGLDLTLRELAQRYPDIDFPDPDSHLDIEFSEEYNDDSMETSDSTTDDERYWSDSGEPVGQPLIPAQRIQGDTSVPTSKLSLPTFREESVALKQDDQDVRPPRDVPGLRRVGASGEAVSTSQLQGRKGSRARPHAVSDNLITMAAVAVARRSMTVTAPYAIPQVDVSECEVLFLGASLFEFYIDHVERESGFSYLTYVAGEIFEVIGVKGELWLARNEDDPTKTVGWIWKQHFARILPRED